MKKGNGTLGKLIGVAACGIAVVMLLTACAGSGDIIGEWLLTGVEDGGGTDSELMEGFVMMQAFGGRLLLSFQKDGKCELRTNVWGFEQSEEHEYSVSGGRLSMDGSSLSYSVSGNTLTLSSGGTKLRLTKQ